ncbi:MAG: transcriptional regulator PpsR [Pseudomonadota bacterium]
MSPNIERHFSDAETHLGPMGANEVANLLSAASDLALILDSDGRVMDMAFSGGELGIEAVDAWIGQPLGLIVADDSRGKIESMFSELGLGISSRRRELNFKGQSGEIVPMNCMAVRFGDAGRTVVFGRDMRGLARLQQRLVNTQISMEREYTRLRQAEACYRLLFQIVGEAVLIIDATTLTVTDANPVAADLLNTPVAKIVGRRASHVFANKDRETLRTLMATVQSAGRAEAVAEDTGGSAHGVDLKASLFRQADVAYILIRLLPKGDHDRQSGSSDMAIVNDVVTKLPDGFVVLDEQRRVVSANDAFLELVQAVTPEQAMGKTVESWFERSSVDANVLFANVREYGSVRRFPTVMRGELGSSEDVEISAVTVPDAKSGAAYGLVVRRVLRNLSEEAPVEGLPARSAEQLTDLIGHMSLKEVVRETTDVVERLCIEAALKLTGDNRASAAQMLGVSRQSLYAKMHRFGLGDLSSDAD